MKKSINIIKKVEVTWNDAFVVPNNSWISKEFLEGGDLIPCTGITRGWLVKEDKEYLGIAQTIMGVDPRAQSIAFDNIIFIKRSMITKIKQQGVFKIKD